MRRESTSESGGNASAARRAAYCYRLGKSGNPSALPYLIEALSDEDWLVRKQACAALSARGCSEAMTALMQMARDSHPSVRLEAIAGLVRIGAPDVTTLQEWLRDPDGNIRRVACKGLGKIGESAIDLLVEAMQDSHELVRCEAAIALGRIGDSAVPYLDRMVNSSDTPVALAAVAVLKQIRSASAVAALTKALRHSHHPVRAAACKALALTGDATTLSLLQNALQDNHYEVRAAACEAISKVGGFEAAKTLVPMLQDTSKTVKSAALQALKSIDADAVVRASELLFSTASTPLRRAICHLLGEIGSTSATQLLLTALDDVEWTVRQEACASTGRLRDLSTVEKLRIVARQDSSIFVCAAACTALGEIGSLDSVLTLIDALTDAVENVRSAAREALVKIGVDAIPPLLQTWLHSENPTTERVEEVLVQLGASAVSALVVIGQVEPENCQRVLNTIGSAIPSLEAAISECISRSWWDVIAHALPAVPVQTAVVQQGARAVSFLLRALESENVPVRNAACVALRRIGAPASTALRRIITEGKIELIDPLVQCAQETDYSVMEAALRLLKATWEASKQHLPHSVCFKCWTRCERITTPSDFYTFYIGCRLCRQAGKLKVGIRKIQLIVDSAMEPEYTLHDGVLRLNWMRLSMLGDFDEVIIVQGSDYDVERLCIQIRNETGKSHSQRRKACYVSARLPLSPTVRNLLRDTFGRIQELRGG